MNQETPQKSKLIIDEDWKTQVAREKEQFRNSGIEQASDASSASQPAAAATSSNSTEDDAYDPTKLPPPPPANFALLVSTLGTQALAAMGQLPNKDGKAPPARLDYAKHYIDMLGMLEEKTKSHVTPDESHMLAEWLHQLRMAYVSLSARK